jgi:predicted TIM-barrel fold metal-dependent hydrolase
MSVGEPKLRKDFSVFDCDAHINDPLAIWEKFVEPQDRELVQQSYWVTAENALLNGRTKVSGGHDGVRDMIKINGITIGGPGMNKKLERRLAGMDLTEEQVAYLDHKGAYDPHARVKELDLMGIDQVLVIPTMLVANYPFIESANGAYALAKAYNNWAYDFCQTCPDRLYAAALLPIQNPVYAAQEVRRIAQTGRFPVALIRPIDANGNYPNKIFMSRDKLDHSGTGIDILFKTLEETGVVLGMHTFPAMTYFGNEKFYSPGELVEKTGSGTGRLVVNTSLSFIFESMTWLAQVLLSGFLDRYPRLKMAIFESNASWLPELLEHCDLLVKLYANERRRPGKRLPSEAFYAQCMISFESDELSALRDYEQFGDIGVWASDVYHHDAADAWTTMRRMDDAEVPKSVQAKLMGANARRFYGIEPKTFVTEEREIQRPEWFPKQDEEFEKWWEREAHPTTNAQGAGK